MLLSYLSLREDLGAYLCRMASTIEIPTFGYRTSSLFFLCILALSSHRVFREFFRIWPIKLGDAPHQISERPLICHGACSFRLIIHYTRRSCSGTRAAIIDIPCYTVLPLQGTSDLTFKFDHRYRLNCWRQNRP